MRGGTTQQVRIMDTTPTGIRAQMGAGVVLVLPFANVTAVTMNPPPEFEAAVAANEKGDLSTAFKNADFIVKKYRGLPTEWAQQAMLMLGDIYVALNQLPQAQAQYTDYQRAYPAAPAADISVGMARIDVSKKDFAAAKAKIDPIIGPALKLKNPSKSVSALIGRAFYVSGQIKEQSGDFPGALEDYLRTTAIFPGDRVAAASAQERADALRKEHGTAVP